MKGVFKKITLDDIFARCMPIPNCGCWVWMGPDNGKEGWLAHGKMRFEGAIHYVHRVMWKLVHGRWPTMHIHHYCSVRMCCNPDHLTDILPIQNHMLGRGVETQFGGVDDPRYDPFELVDA